jgi:transcriptional regulator with XRE-family HTH domain
MKNNLRKLREARNKTVAEICNEIEISPTYYYELEKGEKRLNETLLRKLSDFYKVPVDYILNIDNSKVTSGLYRENYIDEGTPLEVREEIERYKRYLIEQYEKGEYKVPRKG